MYVEKKIFKENYRTQHTVKKDLKILPVAGNTVKADNLKTDFPARGYEIFDMVWSVYSFVEFLKSYHNKLYHPIANTCDN